MGTSERIQTRGTETVFSRITSWSSRRVSNQALAQSRGMGSSGGQAQRAEGHQTTRRRGTGWGNRGYAVSKTKGWPVCRCGLLWQPTEVRHRSRRHLGVNISGLTRPATELFCRETKPTASQRARHSQTRARQYVPRTGNVLRFGTDRIPSSGQVCCRCAAGGAGCERATRECIPDF